MLRIIIVNPDREVNLQVQRVLAEIGDCNLLRILDRYPGPMELSRLLRAHAPQVVMIGDRSTEDCVAVASQVQHVMPGIQVIALGREGSAETLMQVMRAGIREYLCIPFPREVVRDCLRRCADTLTKHPVNLQATDLVYSFLPAKPGSGATTIALNSSVAAAAGSNDTLLADFDLNSGLLRFLLKLSATNSVVDALTHAQAMDELLWPQLVTRSANVDVLHAGIINPDIRIEASQVQHLLDFARRHYKLICLDLSGNLEKYSLELMHESKRVFVVCTPEVASIHLAREKIQYLKRTDIGSRVSLLLNRYHKRCEVQPEDVQNVVGVPVDVSFPNEYARINQAVQQGRPVERDSAFGRQCLALAETMLDKKVESVTTKRRFIEYFSIAPARGLVEGRRA